MNNHTADLIGILSESRVPGDYPVTKKRNDVLMQNESVSFAQHTSSGRCGSRGFGSAPPSSPNRQKNEEIDPANEDYL